MRNKSKISITLSILVFSISFAALTALAAPFFGEEMHITQPDGRVVFVRAYGDEFYHRLESLDGYTLIHDPESGYLCYAALNADRSEFLSTGIVYSNEAARDTNVRRLLHVTKGLELDQRHIDRKVQEARLLLLGDEQESRTSIRENTVNATRSDGSVAPIYGVTIIVDFPDTKATQPSFSIAEVEAILNEEGYTGFGNNGSVRDYFLDMSGGLVDYRNRVFYYEAEHSKLHYAAGLRGDGVLANEALLGIMHNQDFIDYLLEVGDDVWMPARGNEMALNIYYAGASLSGALWPHYAQLGNLSQTIHGVSFNRYQITNQFTSTVDTGLSIGMFVHENGHLLFSFTDLYGFQGIGYYCVMANGDSARKNPTPINPYFRYLAGWADPLSLNDMPSGTVIAAEANARNPYIYYTHNPQQQFMVEYIQKEVGSRYEHFPHEGVVVYHITRNGTNLADRSYPMVWVVSAGYNNYQNLDIRLSNSGRSVPYPWQDNDTLSPTSAPSSSLYGSSLYAAGQRSGFHITNITENGEFTFVGSELTAKPDLTYNATTSLFEYTTLSISSQTGSVPHSVHVTVARYRPSTSSHAAPYMVSSVDLGAVLLDANGNATVNTAALLGGSPSHSPTSLLNIDPALNEFLQITISANGEPHTHIRNQIIRPILLEF